MALEPFDEVVAFYTGPRSEAGEPIRLLLSDLGAWIRTVPAGGPEARALAVGLRDVLKVARRAGLPVMEIAFRACDEVTERS